MDTSKQTARTAGVFYLLFLVFGGFAQIIRGNIIIPDNAAATINNILANAMLFRLSIVSDLVGEMIYIFLALALYKLLNSVNKNVAVLMVVLVLVGVPIAMISQFYQFSRRAIIKRRRFLKGV